MQFYTSNVRLLMIRSLTNKKGGCLMKIISEVLDYISFLLLLYFCYLGLKYAPQIESLIIEMKGGVI